MDSKLYKIITVEERELIPHVGEIDPGNPPEPQYNVTFSRQFMVKKFDARLGIKVKFLLVSKILPMIDMVMPMFFGGNVSMANVNEEGFLDNVLSAIDLDRLGAVIGMIEDKDLDKLINYSLSHCFEQLPAGPVRVLNQDGTYGVKDVEHDGIFMLRLVVEAVWWGMEGFFKGSRWSSIFKPMAALFPQNTPTSMNFSMPPLPEGTGNSMNFGMGLTR